MNHRTATGDKNGFKIPSSSSSSDNSNNKDKEQMFPDNPARRGSISGGKKPPKDSKKIKTANESDVSLKSTNLPSLWNIPIGMRRRDDQ